ncbi:hypothetical protein VNI00_008600 [Paramarasmius palmivorus]|uniref:Zn(2)-C6 fungal-type domain-containing protein n=1 Tax=Paramarasmius palmivorus TaxID=297713 RepID=A0AAW0CTP0_9AGAR
METTRSKKKFIKSHTKSRLGCFSCKERRVKCDEVHPICGNCEHRDMECVWPPSKPATPSPRPPDHSPAYTSPTPSFESPLGMIPVLDVSGFKLVHHYSLVTSLTLNHGNASAQYTNQFVVPSIAFKEPAFMHALLALSSIHLHTLYHPLGIADMDYYGLAKQHKDWAVTLTSAKPISHTNTPSSDTHLLTRNFLIIYTIAESLGVTGPQGIFSLIDTVRDALKDQDYFYRDEQLKPLNWPFVGQELVPSDDEAIRASFEGNLRLFPPALKDLHLPTSTWPDPEEVSDPDISVIYQESISRLRASWYMSQIRRDAGLVGASSWIVSISDAFRDLLVLQNRPRALVVLYFYCVMLGNLDSKQCWWAAKSADCLGWIGMMLDGEWMEKVLGAMAG